MRQPLAIAVAQPPTVSYDVAANALAHADAVRSAGARIVVFPELSLTGYELDADAVSPEDPRLAPIVEACRETSSVALVGAPVADERGKSFIGVLAVDGTGARVAYRKMWLGGAEPDHFSAGPDPVVIDVDGWGLGLAVCKDTGVPQHAADTAGLGMDVYVAGVLEHADDAAVPDARARRIAAEHHVWVAIASFAGSTGGGYRLAAGGSGIWTPSGTAVVRAGSQLGAIARTTVHDTAQPGVWAHERNGDAIPSNRAAARRG